MRALIKHAPGEGNVSLCELPEPTCGDGRVKIEVRFCGVCGTDLHVAHDTFPNYPPIALGHEFSGVAAEVGRGVSKVVDCSLLKKGTGDARSIGTHDGVLRDHLFDSSQSSCLFAKTFCSGFDDEADTPQPVKVL
jgi:NADPH:quinone reductase-like Zn-dependent oxidoreductase